MTEKSAGVSILFSKVQEDQDFQNFSIKFAKLSTEIKMKAELIERFKTVLQAEDIMSVRDQVRIIRGEWKSETTKEKHIQLEEFRAGNADNPEVEFTYVPHELEGSFQDLLKVYEDKIQEAGKKLAAERTRNFEIKTDLCDRMERLSKSEENIGKAFSVQKEIKEYWDATGDVPGDKYPALIDRWNKANQDFFYHINIYKELQANDLKVNQKRKEELVTKIAELSAVESINELEVLVRKLQREWMEIGPVPKETFKELGDTFFAALRVEQDRIQAHYDVLNKNSEENLSKKQALIGKMKEVLAIDLGQHSSWNKWTDEVMKLQEEWRTTGWVKKKENEELWQEFRGLCDLFFAKRGEFYEGKKKIAESNKVAKEAIIAEAKKIQDSTDWKKATDAIKQLQEKWKSIGSADKDEQKLWQRFRSACDLFFQKKKEHFGELTGLQEDNLRLKEALLSELEATELTGNKGADLNMLREFNEKWQAIGHVPREKYSEIQARHKSALDAKYGKLNAERKELEMSRFKARVSNIRSSGESGVRKERSILRDKIDRLNQEIKQYENNMGIFTGKGAENMRKEIEKKIKSAQREISEIKEKMALLNEE